MSSLDDLQFHDLVGQQTDAPAGVSRWRLRAGQRDQPRLGLTIKDRLDRRGRALLAAKHRLQPFFHQLAAHAGNHRFVAVQSPHNAIICPAFAQRALVGLEKNARLQDRSGRRLALGNHRPKMRTFLAREFDNIFLP